MSRRDYVAATTDSQGSNSRIAATRSAARSYRKRPVVIEAFQWTGDYDLLEGILGLNWGRADAKEVPWGHQDTEEVVIYNSAEKVWLPLPVDHWVVRGVRGEFYPVDPSIFEETYEPVE